MLRAWRLLERYLRERDFVGICTQKKSNIALLKTENMFKANVNTSIYGLKVTWHGLHMCGKRSENSSLETVKPGRITGENVSYKKKPASCFWKRPLRCQILFRVKVSGR